jgi:hypothetical protein
VGHDAGGANGLGRHHHRGGRADCRAVAERVDWREVRRFRNLAGLVVDAGRHRLDSGGASGRARTRWSRSCDVAHSFIDRCNAAAGRGRAEVLSGLKARGFIGVAVTHKDGSTVALAPGVELGSDQAVMLSNGQKVLFDRITSIDIEQPWDGSVKLNLVNGQQLVTKATNYTFYGKNDLGPYSVLLENLKRIDFVRAPDKP